MYQRWRTARNDALDALRVCPPGTRLPWATSPLSPATLATTRLAEYWAHALDITGPLGIAYSDTARLRHIASLAVRTLPYAFAVAGLEARPVRCELTGPDGERWEFGPAGAESCITGAAGAFCRVAAQRLAPEASGLTATEPDAATAPAGARPRPGLLGSHSSTRTKHPRSSSRSSAPSPGAGHVTARAGLVSRSSVTNALFPQRVLTDVPGSGQPGGRADVTDMRRRGRGATETGRTSARRPKPGRHSWPGDQPFYMTGPLGLGRCCALKALFVRPG